MATKAFARIAAHPWTAPAILVALLAPAAVTWAGARVLIQVETRRAERLRADHADLFVANARATAARLARSRIAPLFTTPTIGTTAARLTEALPADADLQALGMDTSGMMSVTIAAPDPDRLRESLRGGALLGNLHETNQRDGGDGRVWISLRGPAG